MARSSSSSAGPARDLVQQPGPGRCAEELDVDYAGENLTVGFNARYLLDAINAIGEKEVRFSFQDSLSPSRITLAEDEKTLAVVMPMRI
ncbi:MAG: hypothetical protein R3E53_06665 [Myxococcota bacterium]